MGLKNLFFFDSDEVSDGFQKNVIRRSQLLEAVGHGIQRSDMREVNPALANRLIQVARTADKVDTGTFKCRDSCGCPLTQAGVVVFSRASTGEGIVDENVKAAAVEFYTAFDLFLGYSEETSLTVVEG